MRTQLVCVCGAVWSIANGEQTIEHLGNGFSVWSDIDGNIYTADVWGNEVRVANAPQRTNADEALRRAMKHDANASLIAVANDLLEALRDVMKYVAFARETVDPGMFDIGIQKAAAAIAKAGAEQ